jgi:hypothetical protein
MGEYVVFYEQADDGGWVPTFPMSLASSEASKRP